MSRWMGSLGGRRWEGLVGNERIESPASVSPLREGVVVVNSGREPTPRSRAG